MTYAELWTHPIGLSMHRPSFISTTVSMHTCQPFTGLKSLAGFKSRGNNAKHFPKAHQESVKGTKVTKKVLKTI
jgi:hypothetical protein